MYPDATMGALAIGALIELIPLGGILLGMSIMERSIAMQETPEPQPAPTRKPRPAVRRKPKPRE
jgi:hypothetical protein